MDLERDFKNIRLMSMLDNVDRLFTEKLYCEKVIKILVDNVQSIRFGLYVGFTLCVKAFKFLHVMARSHLATVTKIFDVVNMSSEIVWIVTNVTVHT